MWRVVCWAVEVRMVVWVAGVRGGGWCGVVS